MNIAYSILSAASTVEAAVTAEASSGPWKNVSALYSPLLRQETISPPALSTGYRRCLTHMRSSAIRTTGVQ